VDLTPACWVEISCAAFARNVRHVRTTLAHDAQLMIAVKSDAYGHGEREIAQTAMAAGANCLAVLDIDTGHRLRPHVADTLLLAWLLSHSDDFTLAREASLDLGISALWQLEKLEREVPGGGTSIHLKIDTGLHRNGALPELWPALCERAEELEKTGTVRVVGIWSHLADTSIADNRAALDLFHAAVERARGLGLRPTMLHIAASAAATDIPESRLDIVRVGISAYGVSPFGDRSATDLGLEPVMVPRAFIVEIDQKAQTARVGMGFGDGLLALPADTGWVSRGSEKLALRHVEVDHLLVSVPSGSPAALGDTITLWGEPHKGTPSAEDWAQWAGTIGDEVVASMGPDVERRFSRD
jgi:alanine racemase